MTHTTGDLHNYPPPGSRVPRRNSSTGEGGWALWRPLRTDIRQEHRTGTSRAEQTERRPRRSREPWRPWQVVFVASSLGPATPARTLLPPPIIFFFHGAAGVYQEPSGAKQKGTRQDSPLGLDKQDKTRQDRTAHRNRKPSWASLEAEASSGHDKESGALTGSLSNRFHLSDRSPDESPWTRPT